MEETSALASGRDSPFPSQRWGGKPGNLLFRHSVKILLAGGYAAFSLFVLKQGELFFRGALLGASFGVFQGAQELKGLKARKNLRIRTIDSYEVQGAGLKICFIGYQLVVNAIWLGINTGLNKLAAAPWSYLNGALLVAPLATRVMSTALVAVRRRDTVAHYAATCRVPVNLGESDCYAAHRGCETVDPLLAIGYEQWRLEAVADGE